MIRPLSGLVSGMIVALIVIIGVQWLGYQIVPLPGFDEAQPVGTDQPLGTQLFVLLAWTSGVLLGSAVAVRVSRRPWAAWVIAAAIAISALFRFAMMAQPTWFMAASIPLLLLAGLIGQRLARVWRSLPSE
ncbi:MAG TPA: hypothetical protein VM346_02980 [Sphingomicrobium sp.]|jgi:hypothetical protein|nr:hypothetical protein [Sphingomicrobium sp.]HXH53236.1 hypothetical protein [Sphingomicrobium sp.]